MEIQKALNNTNIYRYDELIALKTILTNRQPLRCNGHCKGCTFRRVCLDLDEVCEAIDNEISKQTKTK